jgi:adenylate cyclase
MPWSRPAIAPLGALVFALVVGLGYLFAGKPGALRNLFLGKPTIQVLSVTSAGSSLKAVADSSLAVLPFVDMSELKDQEYFADGMSEELIDLLAKVLGLRVPARTSSFYFKGKSADIAWHWIGCSALTNSTIPGCRFCRWIPG